MNGYMCTVVDVRNTEDCNNTQQRTDTHRGCWSCYVADNVKDMCTLMQGPAAADNTDARNGVVFQRETKHATRRGRQKMEERCFTTSWERPRTGR